MTKPKRNFIGRSRYASYALEPKREKTMFVETRSVERWVLIYKKNRSFRVPQIF